MIYFDNAATTYVDKEILDSFVTAIEKVSGNSSSLHKEGTKALVMEQKARKQIASFFNAEENDVLFTSGATESNNLAIRGVAFKYQNRGRHIITTKIEHLSVLETLKQPQYNTLPVESQVVILFAVMNGYLADIDVKDVAKFNEGLVKYVQDKEPQIITSIKDKKELKSEIEEELRKAVEDYKAWFKV